MWYLPALLKELLPLSELCTEILQLLDGCFGCLHLDNIQGHRENVIVFPYLRLGPVGNPLELRRLRDDILEPSAEESQSGWSEIQGQLFASRPMMDQCADDLFRTTNALVRVLELAQLQVQPLLLRVGVGDRHHPGGQVVPSGSNAQAILLHAQAGGHHHCIVLVQARVKDGIHRLESPDQLIDLVHTNVTRQIIAPQLQ